MSRAQKRHRIGTAEIAVLLLAWLLPLGYAIGQSGYQNYQPQAEQQVSAPLFVTIAYSLFWAVPLLYLVVLWRRQSRLAEELSQLRRELDS